MPWQVIEYMDQNPQSSPREVISHFATTLEIDGQLESIKNEVENVLLLREQLRPLYGKKFNAEQAITSLNSEFDMDVMVKYPPRKGTDKERKAYKMELQNNSDQFQAHQQVIDEAKEEIEKLEEELYAVQQKAKNARQILETFKQYCQYIVSSSMPINVGKVEVADQANNNANMF